MRNKLRRNRGKWKTDSIYLRTWIQKKNPRRMTNRFSRLWKECSFSVTSAFGKGYVSVPKNTSDSHKATTSTYIWSIIKTPKARDYLANTQGRCSAPFYISLFRCMTSVGRFELVTLVTRNPKGMFDLGLQNRIWDFKI